MADPPTAERTRGCTRPWLKTIARSAKCCAGACATNAPRWPRGSCAPCPPTSAPPSPPCPRSRAPAASRSTRPCSARSIPRSSAICLNERRAEVAYPRVVSTVPPLLAFCAVAPGETLATGRFSIPEPRAAAALDGDTLDIIFVPGVAFARNGAPPRLRPRLLRPRPLRHAPCVAHRAVPRLPARRPLAAARRRRAGRPRSNPARTRPHRRARARTRGGALVTVIGIVLCLAALVVGVVVGMMMFGKQQSAVPEAERTKLVEAARAEAAEVKRAAQLEAKELRAQGARRSRRRAQGSAAPSCRKPKRRCAGAKRSCAKKRARSRARRPSSRRRRRPSPAASRRPRPPARRAEELLERVQGQAREARRHVRRRGAQAELHGRRSSTRRKQAAADRGQEDRGRGQGRGRGEVASASSARPSSATPASTSPSGPSSVVPLPSDDMKGRIIGREGRNIRALEAATGIDLIIDDTPEAVVISCFNPVRREIARAGARRASSPTGASTRRASRRWSRRRPTRSRRSARRPASRRCSISGCTSMHPELVRAARPAQVPLDATRRTCCSTRSRSASSPASWPASWGCNVKIARRAGLLHDIGKAIDQEVEGSHAAVGAAARAASSASRRGSCAAIAAHHGEEPHRRARPHRRRGQRAVRASGRARAARCSSRTCSASADLEKLAEPLPRRASAPSPSRPAARCACIVENSQVSDEQACMLAKDIAKRIEAEVTYPGQVRVSVIRETRATDYAK